MRFQYSLACQNDNLDRNPGQWLHRPRLPLIAIYIALLSPCVGGLECGLMQSDWEISVAPFGVCAVGIDWLLWNSDCSNAVIHKRNPSLLSWRDCEAQLCLKSGLCTAQRAYGTYKCILKWRYIPFLCFACCTSFDYFLNFWIINFLQCFRTDSLHEGKEILIT